MTDDLRRRLRLLVPGPEGKTVATIGGRLPSVEVSLIDGETTLSAAWRALPGVGLGGPLLTCGVDQRPDADLAGVARQVVVALEPPASDWTPPPDWAWSRTPDVDADLPDPLRDLARRWADEIVGRVVLPDERAAWSRPGWYARAADWVDEMLAGAGRARSSSIVQFRQWGISTVLRVETPDGRCWFKAAFPGFRQEAAVTEWLDGAVPGAVPPVLAAEPDEGWLLLGDLGDRTESGDEETTRNAIDRLVAIQQATTGRTDRLLALGAPDRRLRGLVDDFAEAMRSRVAAEFIDTTGTSDLIGPLAEAITRVDGVLPNGLVHGDFHPGNAARTDRGAVVFDWSDAAIACPVVDIATWTWWYPDDAERIEHVWACFEAAWQRAFGVASGSVDRRAAMAVAGAYHAVSYVRILEGLEPLARLDHADGLIHFHDVLVDACADVA